MPKEKKIVEETQNDGVQEKPTTPKVQLKARPLTKTGKKFPAIVGGVCEHCGLLDTKVAPDQQYTICPHYNGLELFCTYCGRSDIIKDRKMNVFEIDGQPGVYTIVCSDYACQDKFNKEMGFSPKS